MILDYDLLVIGTGTTGSFAAMKCRKQGCSVAITDERDFGGTCALRGCSPKKILVGASRLYDHNTHMMEHNVSLSGTDISWKGLIDFKRTFTESFPAIREQSYADAGIDSFHDKATFVSTSEVSVGDKIVRAKKILVASGSVPRRVGVGGESLLLTSEDFLELESLPRSIVFVGGGFVSFELAHIACRMGSEVTIVHSSATPLKQFDQDLVVSLVESSRELGIRVLLETQVGKLENNGDGISVISIAGDVVCSADIAVHGAGRVPNIESLALEKGGVAAGPGGVKVNGFLQSTTNPRVYAGGDCVDGYPMLRWVAERHGTIAAHNMVHGNSMDVGNPVVPAVLFTTPQLCSVGLGEKEAEALGMDVEVAYTDFSDWFSVRYKGDAKGIAKILKLKGEKTIVGAHVLSNEAGNIANVLMLAISQKMTASELKSLYWAFPTETSDIPYLV